MFHDGPSAIVNNLRTLLSQTCFIHTTQIILPAPFFFNHGLPHLHCEVLTSSNLHPPFLRLSFLSLLLLNIYYSTAGWPRQLSPHKTLSIPKKPLLTTMGNTRPIKNKTGGVVAGKAPPDGTKFSPVGNGHLGSFSEDVRQRLFPPRFFQSNTFPFLNQPQPLRVLLLSSFSAQINVVLPVHRHHG